MRLATIVDGGVESAVLVRGASFVRLADLRDPVGGDAMAALSRFSAADLAERMDATDEDRFRPVEGVRFTAPYRRPRKIWGIGLNYAAHARDLSQPLPGQEPASFIKGDHTVIGPGDPIPLPAQSGRVTAEAELGLVIGRHCRDVDARDALAHVWGVTTVLDQTAEDILQRNPRFLTRSKNFPGFLSFGPDIVPLDDVLGDDGTLDHLEVATVVNGRVRRSDVVANMTFGPAELVAFHSRVMPWFPGDILCTGTPGAVPIHSGDVAECRIAGVGALVNPVV